MVNKCCICKYRVGNFENNPRLTLFKAPTDEELYKKWETVFISVGCLLKKSSFVCENHFLKKDIIKERVIKDISGNVLFQRSLRRRRLALNAIPVFFNTSLKIEQNNEGKYYIHNSATNPEPPLAVIQDLLNVPSCIGQSSTLISENYSKSLELNDIVNDVKTESISATSNDTCTNIIIERKCLDIFSTFHCLKLPNTLWAVHKVDLPKKMLIVNKVRPSLTEEPNVSVIEKQVVLQENGNCQIFIFNKLVKVYDTYPNTCEEVEIFIRKMDSLKICTGGPSIYEYRNVHCTCAYQDITNKWRHNLCEWVLEIGTVCKQCLKLHSTLRRHFDTAVKKNNPSTTKLSLLTKTNSQTSKRYKIRSKKIRAKIRNAKREIKKANKEKGEKNLEECLRKHKEKYNIPHNQELVIKECLFASKRKSPKGRKYNTEWLLLCLLLHIKSPKTYNFLRRNEIMPLPAHSTVRKYMSMVDIGCGFDIKFFELLKKKFEKVPERAKHGMLIFDEMQVRQSLEINSKKFTFEGCANVGVHSDSNKFTELADHALVFMFRSLGDKFIQSVGVFASKGPTRGQTLAEIVLQAIILVEKAGGYIDGIVCDGAATNRKMWKEFGVSGKLNSKLNHFFENPVNPKRKVYVFSDTPHLFKCVRNTIQNRGKLKVDGQYVQWVDYENLYKVDQLNPGNLRVCPKLTANHINPSNCLKMRVFLATQIFSKSVADGLEFYRSRGVDTLSNCGGTIQFTLRMNYLFDALNRNHSGVTLGQTKDLELLRESLNWLNNWEEDIKKKKNTSFGFFDS